MTPSNQRAFDFFSTPAPQSGPPPRRNLVIEAGAGTGKTTAIVAEVLKLMVEREGLDPERIVLVTFTEKAAGEIADRIRNALAELFAHLDDDVPAWPHDSPRPLVTISDRDAARRSIARHLEQIDKLRSQTIHSFCQQLLRMFPIEAGLDPQFKIIEGFERSRLYGELYDAWVDRETRIEPREEIVREWELLFEHVGYLFAIRSLVFSLVDRRDLLSATDYEFGDFSLVQNRLADAVAWIRRDPSIRVKDDAANDITEFLETHPPSAATRDEWIDYLAPIAPRLRQVDLRYCAGLKEPMAVLRSGGKGDSIYDRLVSDRAAAALLSMTRRFLDFLDAEKRTRGVADFDDLLLRTSALLDDPVVLQRVRGQFDFIFVDEFQDTDRTQASIVDRLARDASGAYVPGRTVVVGDPKQSIYGFRRADPETYAAMTEKLQDGGAELRRLGENYRSDAPLLEAINAMFATLFPPGDRDPNVFRPSYNALEPGKSRSERETDARVTLLQVESDEKADRFLCEAEAVARLIASKGEGDLRRFAILFRRMSWLDEYLDTLDRHGIAYVLPPTKMFLDRRAPVELLAVLRAIGYPFDKGAQISAARTPYFALTDDEIVRGTMREAGSTPPPVIPTRAASNTLLRFKRLIALFPLSRRQQGEGGASAPGEGNRRRGEQRQRIHATSRLPSSALRALSRVSRREKGTTSDSRAPWSTFAGTIERYRQAATHLTVAELIDLVVETSGIEAVYAAMTDGLRHERHLEHLRRLAFEYDRKIGGSVRQFVDEIERRRAEPDEMEPALADDATNAVRILTVHAAKGLEFDTVILPDLSFPVGSQDATQLFTVEEPKMIALAGRAETLSANFAFTPKQETLKEVAAAREKAETQRLFYVAVTRARCEVVFVCNTGKSTKAEGFLKSLYEVFGVDKTGLAALWPAAGREVRSVPIGGAPVPVAFERAASEAVPLGPAASRMRLHDRDLERQLAAGAIVPLELPQPDLVTVNGGAHRPSALRRATGIVLHRFLELWNGRESPETLLQKVGSELAAEPDTLARVRQQASRLQRSPHLARIHAAETIARELPIRFVREGATLERRIDRIIREQGVEYVVDYKSGARKPEDRLQVGEYCRAVSSMTGRECRGLIWYLETDELDAV